MLAGSKIFFTTTLQAVWESGTFQKDGGKREYPNLFNGRQPYRLEDPFGNIEAILI